MALNAESTPGTSNFIHRPAQKDGVKSRKKSKKLPKSVRIEEFRDLIKAIPKKDVVNRAAFLLAYGAGMRLSEVLRSTPGDWRENSIFIPESKYGVERVVPIPKGWKKEFMSLLPLSKVRGGSKRSLQRNFKKYAAKAKLNPAYTFHSLRHGFATRALESGVPPNQVQMLLGHSNLSTTSIYTKANPTDALKSYEDLF